MLPKDYRDTVLYSLIKKTQPIYSQLNQTKRQRPYGELVSISPPPIPFHTIAMDFIVAGKRNISGPDCIGLIFLSYKTSTFNSDPTENSYIR